jgi:sugar phosphate isomerase/epimerase
MGPAALQLWTVRDALTADTDGALDRVKAAGFSTVELAPLPPGLIPERLADSLACRGLSVVSIHGDLPTLSNLAEWERIARACRCSKLVWHGWPRDPRFSTLDGLRALILDWNAAEAMARDLGLEFGLHNHWWEFEPVEGERPIRLFHELLHPNLFWQLDVYWARTAGADPVAVLAELAPRIRSLHLKDGPAVHGRPMTALGQGVVDVPRILRALTAPTDLVIELDECSTDPLDAARDSLAYLESLRDRPAGQQRKTTDISDRL